MAARIIRSLTERGRTIAVAESLTGGLLVAELISPPGASKVVLGGIVAYQSELKADLLGVDSKLLESKGAIDPDVALQMADGVRFRLAVGSKPADLGISTTGVAGPDLQDGHPPGTVYIAVSAEGSSQVRRLGLEGSRDQIRTETVGAALSLLAETLELGTWNPAE
ncbi:MAG: nicotinamide-nucleotide amidohydrolase family protein [Cryobacterium sp.]|nr:nicotinamide-nucleotide amidohydrolase family protein [Cryobacterium sp.]